MVAWAEEMAELPRADLEQWLDECRADLAYEEADYDRRGANLPRKRSSRDRAYWSLWDALIAELRAKVKRAEELLG